MVVVGAEAAFAAQAKIQLSQRRGYGVVIACARTWGVENGHPLKELVTHVPPDSYRRCWVPLAEPGRRRPSGTVTQRARLRHMGDVTLSLSQKRRNEGPKQPKMLVTHLPEARARQVVAVYRRRWAGERLGKDLQGALGLGQQQVTKEPQRVERSLAISVMASLRIVKSRARDIPEPGAWSMFTLKRHFRWQVAPEQIERSVAQRLRKGLQERKAA
jgi:hypothetical protein